MAEKADASSTYSIDLDENVSGAAESAASALQTLQRQMDADTSSLRAMEKAMRNLQAGSVVNIDQFRKLKAAIDLKKQSIAQAQGSYLALGGTFSASKRGASGLVAQLQALSKTAQGMPGPIGGLVGNLGKMQGLLAGGAIAVGVAAIAAALVALAAAAVYATGALIRYGIAQAGARRSELLRLEGLTKMRNWWGIAAGNAADMQGAIDRVSGSTALGRDKLSEYTGELYKMGLRGKNLEYALEAAAIKGAVLGDEGAKSAMQWAAGMHLAGNSVKRLADDVKARFGGVAAAQLLDLNVQTAKLRENFGALFSRLKIEALLKAVSGITALFSQSTRSGQALRAIFETLLQPLINSITAAAPLVKRFFQGMIVGALYVTIALLQLRNWFRRTFRDSDLLQGLDLQKVALYLGAAAVGALAAAFTLLAAVMITAAAPFLLVGVQLYLLGRAVRYLVTHFDEIKAAVARAWDALMGLNRRILSVFVNNEWTQIGLSIARGIVDGLKTGGKWVLDAVSGLGTKAMQALKSTLGIASPSKEFARLGVAIPQGIESGVKAGTPGARDAVARVVEAPRIPVSAVDSGAGAGARASSTPNTITIEVGGITIQTSSDKPAELIETLERELGRVFENVATELGALVPRSAT